MMNFDEKKSELIEALSQHGFKLEWDASDILSGAGFEVSQNYRPESKIPTEDMAMRPKLDVDLLAYKSSSEENILYIVECKGGCSATVLSLVKSPREHEYIQKESFDEKKISILEKDYSNKSIPRTISGDFLTFDNEKFKMANKRTNGFYKGQVQLNTAIDPIWIDYCKKGKFGYPKKINIFPVILVNTPIYVADFSCEAPSPERFKWALAEANFDYNYGPGLMNADWNKIVEFDDEKKENLIEDIPHHSKNFYNWVVDVTYFEEFINSDIKSEAKL
jgi:hypothetical protein